MLTKQIRSWQVLYKGTVLGLVFAMSDAQAQQQATALYGQWDTLLPA